MANAPEVRPDRMDSAVSQPLLDEYVAEIRALYPAWDPSVGPTARPEEVAPPNGAWLVAYLDGEPVGCGAIKRLDPASVELKRLYVRPYARALGVARALIAALEAEAARLGCGRIRLDTGPRQPGALKLFRAAGYTDIDDYNANPVASHWLEKLLG